MSSPIEPIVKSITSVTGNLTSVANTVNAIMNSGPAGVLNDFGKPGNELWYIHAKGKIDRLNPVANPTVSRFYNKSMEQGRLLESSLGDAMTWIQEKKEEYETNMLQWIHLNLLGTDGQLGDIPRKIKYIGDCVIFMQNVQRCMADILGLVQAVEENLVLLANIERSVIGMIQTNLNMLSALLQEICNWGLPDLPAIPNLFGDTIFRFNGFGMLLNQFTANPSIPPKFNFIYNDCHVHLPNLDIFRNYPKSIATSVPNTPLGTPLYNPPLGGLILNQPLAGVIADPVKVRSLQGLIDTPVFVTDFNPYAAEQPATDTTPAKPASMWGSVPNPVNIISNYQMPAATYQANILSIVPQLRFLAVPEDTLSASQIASNMTVLYPTDSQITTLKTALRQYVNLEEIESHNFDPYLVSVWLLYLDMNRRARKGKWLVNFQSAYDTYLQPSIDVLGKDVPWNNFLDEGTNAIPNLPLIPLLVADTNKNLAWKLSWIEAAILGYPRTQKFDSGQDSSYLSSYTGTDLDFFSTPVDYTSLAQRTLGADTANYPSVVTYPLSLDTPLAAAIKQGTWDIANNPSWRPTRPQFRYVYDLSAQAIEVDRFTQYWREYRANLGDLLKQDIYLVQEVISYPVALNSAVNPLSDKAVYNYIKADSSSKNRNWVPGSVYPPIPVESIIPQKDTTTLPGGTISSGWSNGQFDAAAFLSRPDIQAQSVSVQLAMLRTNQSYASLMTFQTQFQSAIDGLRTQAINTINSVKGAHVLTQEEESILASSGTTGVAVSFPRLDYDRGKFVKDVSTIVFTSAGSYVVAGTLHWGTASTAAVRGYNLVLNGNNVLSTDVINSSALAQDQTYSVIVNAITGDTMQLFAFTNVDTTLTANSDLTVSAIPSTASTQQLPPGDIAEATDLLSRILTAGARVIIGQAVSIDATGRVIPVIPTREAIPADSVPGLPYVDGITLSSGNLGDTVQVATSYGSVYQIPGATLTVGGVIYVNADGTMTQSHDTVETHCFWTVVIGRALTPDTILFQPHLPYRVVKVNNVPIN